MDNVATLAASLLQLAPNAKRVLDSMRFLFDQPVIREPYVLGTSATPGAVIAIGATNQILLSSDFSHSLEWPFEVQEIAFSNDPQHTFRDWRVSIQDQTYNHTWMKNPVMVDLLVDANTAKWKLGFPWIIRPMGGGQNIYVDNLDTINPITVNVALIGELLIPR